MNGVRRLVKRCVRHWLSIRCAVHRADRELAVHAVRPVPTFSHSTRRRCISRQPIKFGVVGGSISTGERSVPPCRTPRRVWQREAFIRVCES